VKTSSSVGPLPVTNGRDLLSAYRIALVSAYTPVMVSPSNVTRVVRIAILVATTPLHALLSDLIRALTECADRVVNAAGT
jgi:hypothetical protein